MHFIFHSGKFFFNQASLSLIRKWHKLCALRQYQNLWKCLRARCSDRTFGFFYAYFLTVCSSYSSNHHGRRKRGDGGGTRPPQSKYPGGTSPPKIRMKISNSGYFNSVKLVLFQFHHNFSIVVAVLDRTKPIQVLISVP